MPAHSMPRLVLVVDDDPVRRRLAGAAILKAGYHVPCAEDGASGVAAMVPDLATPWFWQEGTG